MVAMTRRVVLSSHARTATFHKQKHIPALLLLSSQPRPASHFCHLISHLNVQASLDRISTNMASSTQQDDVLKRLASETTAADLWLVLHSYSTLGDNDS